MPNPGDQHRDTPASVNPFVEQKQHVSEYTAREIATLQSRLDRQLGPEYISTRPGAGGGKVHYLAAEKVINLANEIFGFNGWSSAIQNVQIDFVDENPTNGKITLGLSTIVRVTLRNGTYHEDTGYGHIENCKGKAAAFEKAKKEAATDALKRALRNFGNVLGNCLYDKDYLQRVTKVKVAPSRWDAANLHRHPDYAPIKRESIAEADARQEQAAAAKRNATGQSTASFGSNDFDDDFGGNFMDDADFSHPDEVIIKDTSVSKAAPNGPQQGGPSRPNSANQMRPPNLPAPQAPAGIQRPQQPVGVQRPPPGVVGHQPNRMTQPPNQQPPHQQRPQHPPANANHSAPPNQGPVDGDGIPLPQELPPGAPEGFVTGRSAALLDQPLENRPPTSSMAFNPHAESPSIRRTSGANPGKSAPILRTAVGAPAVPSAPGSGSTTPQRSNFVHPAGDSGRRVGMPGGAAAAGMQPNRNGNSYKPLSISGVKRPVLSDMSNIQQTDGASDPKKMKSEPTAPAKEGAEADAASTTSS